MSLKITTIDCWEVAVPLSTEWTSSPEFGDHGHGEESSRRLILRVSDPEGNEGWGESAVYVSKAKREGHFRQLLQRDPDLLTLGLLPLHHEDELYWGRPAAPSPYTPPRHKLMHRLRHPLQNLVETALNDYIGRKAGVPLCQLWGGCWHPWVSVDYWMGRVTPEHAKNCVARALSLGFTGVKLKTTLEDPNVERLEAIREAGGKDFHVTVDPNGRFYNLSDSLQTILAMDAVGNMAVLEDPFPRFHLQEFAALRHQIKARLALHIDPPESIWSVLKAECADALNISYGAQGPWQWRMDASCAERANLPIWHGSGLDLGIATAAQLHLAASAPNCTLPGDQAGPWLRSETLVKQPFEVREGHIRVPMGGGLGIDVDHDALDRTTVDHATITG